MSPLSSEATINSKCLSNKPSIFNLIGPLFIPKYYPPLLVSLEYIIAFSLLSEIPWPS